MPGDRHRDEVLDRSLDDGTAILLGQRPVARILPISREERQACPENRERGHAVATERSPPATFEVEERNACEPDDPCKQSEAHPADDEYQPERRKPPIPVAGIENVEDLDELIGVHRGRSRAGSIVAVDRLQIDTHSILD